MSLWDLNYLSVPKHSVTLLKHFIADIQTVSRKTAQSSGHCDRFDETPKSVGCREVLKQNYTLHSNFICNS